MDYKDLHDTMNRIIDKAQNSVENLSEQYEGSKNDGVDINKRDIDHAFEALRSSIEMSMESWLKHYKRLLIGVRIKYPTIHT